MSEKINVKKYFLPKEHKNTKNLFCWQNNQNNVQLQSQLILNQKKILVILGVDKIMYVI